MRKSSKKINNHPSRPTDNLHFGLIAQKFISNMPFGVIIFDENLNITDSNSFADNILESFCNNGQARSQGTDPKQYSSWQDLLYNALK